jgi:uncharacterized membrane protein
MRISHTIQIQAPLDRVWSATLDLERWPDWTPTVTSLERLDAGPVQVGSRVRIKQPLQTPSEWVVTRLEAGEVFAWETRRPGLRMVGTHEMRAAPTGTTNMLHVDAHGALALVLWPLLLLALGRALRDENLGLARYCEQ